MSIRIAMVDDHSMVREALRICLSAERDFEIVSMSGTAAEFLQSLRQGLPDVVLLDITLPDRNGVDLAREVHHAYPSVRIIALTGHGDRPFIEEMLKAGAQGYVVKSATSIDLVNAVRTVAGGKKYLSMEASMSLLQRYDPESQDTAPPASVLSRREQEVLQLVVEGRRTPQIAAALGIAEGTVEVYRKNIRRKTGIGSVAGLTRYAIREGLTKA